MSMWAQGFEPRQDQANCGPGTKNCGKICIAQGSECHIGKGKVGLAQTIGGAALFGAGFAAAAQGNNAAALGLAAGGLGLYARGQYNIGRSIGHSTPVGGAAKLLTGVQPTPLGLGAAAMGIHKAQKSVRPAVDYPVGAAFKPQPGQEYTAMTPEEYSSYRKREGANALKPAGVDEWGTMIMPLAARNQQPRVNPSMNASSIYSSAEHEAAMQELAQRKAKYAETNRRQMARLENLRNGTVKPRLMDRHGRIEPAAIRQQRTLNAVRKLRKRSAA